MAMNLATLSLTCVLLVVGQAGDDVCVLNQRKVRFPITIKPERRAEIKNLTLYVSADRGRTWNQEAVATPDQASFPFTAPADGEYWFRVATINVQGRQEPEDLNRATTQKVLIDTQRPVVRIANAERQGSEIAVAWDIQEDHPDLASLRVEYRTADTPAGLWEQAAVTRALQGQGRIVVPAGKAVKVRVALRDRALNESVAEADVPAGSGITTAGFTPPPVPPPTATEPAAPVPPPPGATAVTPSAPADVPAPAAAAGPPPAPQPKQVEQAQPAARAADDPMPPAPPAGSGGHLVATSDAAPATPAPAPPASGPPAAVTPPAGPPPRHLPPVQILNSTELTLDCELERVGRSGIGRVELWMTEDDGQTWQRWAEDPEAPSLVKGGKYQRRIELPPKDGVYGFRLVVLNPLGLGEPPPKVGDPPEMRVEVDTTAPRAQLYCEPDPRHEDALLLRWECEDKNLGKEPVTLEWSERPEGPWQTVVDHRQANSEYSWKLPADLPVWVHLRLRVWDKAGNVAVAVTGRPQLADLARPVGHLRGVTVTQRQP
jgi:hypothetical protein